MDTLHPNKNLNLIRYVFTEAIKEIKENVGAIKKIKRGPIDRNSEKKKKKNLFLFVVGSNLLIQVLWK